MPAGCAAIVVSRLPQRTDELWPGFSKFNVASHATNMKAMLSAYDSAERGGKLGKNADKATWLKRNRLCYFIMGFWRQDMSRDHSTSSTDGSGTVLVKCLPLALLIALAFFAWTFSEPNEGHEAVNELETPDLVIEGTTGVGSDGLEEGMLLEPSEDR